MELLKLLERMDFRVINGQVEQKINHLVYQWEEIGTGDLFVCIKGVHRNGHDFILEAVKRGACAIVVEEDLKEEVRKKLPQELSVIKVEHSRKALAYLSAAYFSYPAEKLSTIGITGTKGKTTTAYMIWSVLNAAGIKTGLMGTIETVIGEERIPAGNTTPESYVIQESFDRMVKAGCKAVVMEVSSQGLMQQRVAGVEFDYGIFTNLSKDHIGANEHSDMTDYIYWKSVLFLHCKTGIFNVDDAYAKEMMKNAKCRIYTYGVEKEAELMAKKISLVKEKGKLGVRYNVTGEIPILSKNDVEIDIPGRFSVYNSLAAIFVSLFFTQDMDLITKTLKQVRVRGRGEFVSFSPDFTVMIDYAHNAMSLSHLLQSLREYQPKRILTVFGCGGNRDQSRRFEMGEVSGKSSDLTIITSDNPRFEEPEAIMQDILTGVKKSGGNYRMIPDRKEAIKYAISHASPGDVVVLAGKGHEEYQEIKGIKYKLDEHEILSKLKENI